MTASSERETVPAATHQPNDETGPLMDSDRVDHTLALIDGAIEDWATSGDAMRWVAPVEPWDELAEPIVTPPETKVEQYVAQGMDGYAARAQAQLDFQRNMAAILAVGQNLGRAFEDLALGIRRAAETLSKALAPRRQPCLPLVIFDEDRRLGGDLGKGEHSVWQVAIERRKHRNTGPVVGRYRLDGSRR